ncbi:hypothetical protein HY994_04650 [Candidatus Micrarchaeota archaeon]|nr:hypothetical protein [Candidatus Micrarchaeota archaeon]
MKYETRDVSRTNMWRGTPGSKRFIFNPFHRMNDEAGIQNGEFNLGGKESSSHLHLRNGEGHSISILFSPELFTKVGLNRTDYRDAVQRGQGEPVAVMHAQEGGGAISPVQMEKMKKIALQALGQLGKEKGYKNALKLAKMAMDEDNAPARKAA